MVGDVQALVNEAGVLGIATSRAMKNRQKKEEIRVLHAIAMAPNLDVWLKN